MANQRLFDHWNHLTDALRTGEPYNESAGGGESFFDALYADPAQLEEFLAAMTGISRGANVAIAAQFPWSDYKTFVDAGTAQGDLAVQVALAHPHLTGLGFDLPQVGPVFESYVGKNGLADRLNFAAGSFFDDPLPEVDVVMMGHILHDWNLEEKKLLMSLNMLIETEGGFDYTGADCIGWMAEAGFRETRVEHLVGPDSMVVGIK